MMGIDHRLVYNVVYLHQQKLNFFIFFNCLIKMYFVRFLLIKGSSRIKAFYAVPMTGNTVNCVLFLQL